MSIGNTNFITLDSVAEIQDIVNGDFLFTVSNGVIYKLDFQNLILTPDNVDFYSTIESLSAQVVSLTNAFSSINAQVNELSGAIGLTSIVQSGSANWNSTYSTVKKLSSTTWLPSNNVKSGSLIKYEGGSSSWKVIEPGNNGDTLQVLNNVPQFTGSANSFNNIINEQLFYNSDSLQANAITNITTTNASTGGANYSFIGVNWEVSFAGGEGNITNKSALLIQYNDGRPSQIVKSGTFSIPTGTNSNSQPISFTVIPQAAFGTSDIFQGIRAGTSARKDPMTQELGSFTALGNSNIIKNKRPLELDPEIISEVDNSEFELFVPLLPGGGIPPTFNYVYNGRNSREFKLWDTAVVTLKVYGTPD